MGASGSAPRAVAAGLGHGFQSQDQRFQHRLHSFMTPPNSALGSAKVTRASFGGADSSSMPRRRAMGSPVMTISTALCVSAPASPSDPLEREVRIGERWVQGLRKLPKNDGVARGPIFGQVIELCWMHASHGDGQRIVSARDLRGRSARCSFCNELVLRAWRQVDHRWIIASGSSFPRELVMLQSSGWGARAGCSRLKIRQMTRPLKR